jgi:hypothetical protein
MFEIGKEKSRGLSEGGGCTGKRRRGRTVGRGAGRIRHDEDLGESGNGPSRRALSLDPTGSNPSRPTSRSLQAAILPEIQKVRRECRRFALL